MFFSYIILYIKKITKNQIQFKNYKINPKTLQELQGRPFVTAGTVAGRFLGIWTVAVRGFTRHCKNPRRKGGLERFPPLFSSLPVVAFTVTCNKKRETQAICFKFFCRLVFFCFPFWSADLESGLVHAPPTGQAYGWLDRRLLLSSFISTSAVSPTTSMAGRSVP